MPRFRSIARVTASVETRTLTTGYCQARVHTVRTSDGWTVDFDGSSRGRRAANAYAAAFNAAAL